MRRHGRRQRSSVRLTILRQGRGPAIVTSQMTRGTGAELKLGSVPSIGQIMTPRAIGEISKAFPSLQIAVDTLKIEEARSRQPMRGPGRRRRCCWFCPG